jgi:hypothetical protein
MQHKFMKRLKFVLSLITLDNDYQVDQAVTAEETARRLDVDVQILFADSDANTKPAASRYYPI